MKELKQKLYSIIFEADTREGKLFDEILLGTIIFSILLVMLESVPTIRVRYHTLLRSLEWVITAIFTLEYLTRIWVVNRPWKYVFSFYGMVDLFALLPTYLGLLFTGGHSLIVIRAIRLLRVFRILKLSRYTRAGRLIAGALWHSREKISVFIIFVLTLALIIGTVMYLVEGEKAGFTDIPTSIYWAIVTLTTVGYGDLSPVTGLGKFLASLVMILGYSIIAVPTGIVTASLLGKRENYNTQVCRNCLLEKHDDDARFCKRCGASLEE
ncbi:MAG: ion transporter [Prolixibacteraceae bacterium]|jgi:voltage-gated potassium channel|nr:ion transporter [Prolixibacteraceae bacterium]NLX28896.1 ion transporter [Bacteroidales bacterium]HNQ38778.1 ion transporter [Prolixibacteraceae bacterium]HPJ78273.1 ion transporter [Prolixibacteraceae bacterium]HRV89717.1 ion transporter [Prolixibacteraceae bacterium]